MGLHGLGVCGIRGFGASGAWDQGGWTRGSGAEEFRVFGLGPRDYEGLWLRAYKGLGAPGDFWVHLQTNSNPR